eukprot:SAG31_NODE_341_length_17459_cov_29.188123_2_plen_98_part_00
MLPGEGVCDIEAGAPVVFRVGAATLLGRSAELAGCRRTRMELGMKAGFGAVGNAAPVGSLPVATTMPRVVSVCSTAVSLSPRYFVCGAEESHQYSHC